MYCILTVDHLQMVDQDEVNSRCTSDTYSFGRIFFNQIKDIIVDFYNIVFFKSSIS